MIQTKLFGDEFKKEKDDTYTGKIQTPIYTPSPKKPHPHLLVDTRKYHVLIHEIDSSSIAEEDKKVLRLAAMRHVTYDYELIADYYAHSSPEVQKLMERSGLIIIDFGKAIEYGYVKMSEEVSELYANDYEE